jgi:hypothetical protein
MAMVEILMSGWTVRDQTAKDGISGILDLNMLLVQVISI